MPVWAVRMSCDIFSMHCSWNRATAFRRSIALPLERYAPLRLDLSRLVLRERRGRREFVFPGKRPTGINDRFRMGSNARQFLLSRYTRVERGTPGIANNINLLGRLATCRDCPQDFGEIRRIDVIVYHHD